MSFNSYKLYRRAFAIFSLLCAICYFLFHFNNYLLFDGELSAYAALYDTLEYVRYAVSDMIFFLIPTVSAVLLLPQLFNERAYKLYPLAFLLSLSEVFYNIPYYYIYHIAYGYDSIESISISVPLSLLISLVLAIYSLTLAYVAKLVFLRRGGKLAAYPARTGYFSLSSGVGLSTFFAVFIHFVICFIRELIDAVTFFIEYADSYRIGELIYILGRFVFILALMLIAHAVCIFVHNKILSRRFEAEDDTQKAKAEKLV